MHKVFFMEKEMTYSIGQVAQKTGLSVHTLRYYQKEGLLPFVAKTASGLRVFSDQDLGWLSMIECLKATGMTLKGIKQYIDWFIEGDATLEKRLQMFIRQEQHLEKQLRQLEKNMQMIRFKIHLYGKAVELGSLEKADKDKELQKERQKLSFL